MKKYLVLSALFFVIFTYSLYSVDKYVILSKSENEVIFEFENKKKDSLLAVVHSIKELRVSPVLNVNYLPVTDLSNNAFTEASIIGKGNFVVYKGSSEKERISLKRLEPSTKYSIVFYSLKSNKPAIKNYQRVAEFNFSTLAFKPKNPSKNVVFAKTEKTDEITVLWKKGDGEKTIILCRELTDKGKTETVYPKNGKHYIANSVFGDKKAEIENSNNYIVYEGIGRKDNKATITGLKSGTPYHFEVLEANGEGESIHYLIPENTNISSKIKFTAFVPPIAINATEITSDSFIANWEPINFAEYYLIDVSDASDFSKILDGYKNLDVGNYSDWLIQGLEKGKTYYYRVKARTKIGITTEWSNIMKVILK